MNSTALSGRESSRRKLIDIPDGVFRALSVKAAATGMNLKNYIEKLLAEDASEMDDAELYRFLAATRPQGQVMLDPKEKADFENWLDDNR